MSEPVIRSVARTTLLVVTAFVALTAFLGGLALVLGATVPSLATVLSPPVDYLAGTPFTSYLQAVYFVAGVAEAGLVMVRLDLFGRLAKTA